MPASPQVLAFFLPYISPVALVEFGLNMGGDLMLRHLPLVGPHPIDKITYPIIVARGVVSIGINTLEPTPIPSNGVVEDEKEICIEGPLPWPDILIGKAEAPDTIDVVVDTIVPPLNRVSVVTTFHPFNPATPAVVGAEEKIVILGVGVDMGHVILPPDVL